MNDVANNRIKTLMIGLAGSNKTRISKGLEDEARLSSPVLNILNQQIKNELVSSQIYRGMSCWLNKEGWVEGTKLFTKYANEELIHMAGIYEYIFDKNSNAITPSCEGVVQSFKDIADLLTQSLQHEMVVTKNWNEIAKISLKAEDNDTYALAQKYLKEQIEEENKFRDVLLKIKKDMPLYEIDELFKELNG